MKTCAEARRARAAPLALAATLLAACGGSPAAPVPPGPSDANALRLSVNGSLCSAGSYIDKPCVEVTVCTPDQVNCHVVTDVLLDTGSFGFRVFKQALPFDLPAVAAGTASLATCARFGDGSSDWGPVRRAALLLGQEPAVTVPIQVIDATFGPPPAACTAPDTGPGAAGFNGILGVGPFVADCGPACASSAGNGVYYACGASGCAGYAAAQSIQVHNPIPSLAADGDGLVIHLPAVAAGGQRSAEGELRLGIATRANNQPGAVTPLALDGYGEFRATAMSQSWSAFVDTGSNGYFFTPPASVTTLTPCAAPLVPWYCPATMQTFSGMATPAGGGAGTPFGFAVDNFASLVSGSDAVFDAVGGAGLGAALLDLGLPFHLGRDVWIVFDGKHSALGTGPLVAF
jgi:predicted aspartyl protease